MHGEYIKVWETDGLTDRQQKSDRYVCQRAYATNRKKQNILKKSDMLERNHSVLQNETLVLETSLVPVSQGLFPWFHVCINFSPVF